MDVYTCKVNPLLADSLLRYHCLSTVVMGFIRHYSCGKCGPYLSLSDVVSPLLLVLRLDNIQLLGHNAASHTCHVVLCCDTPLALWALYSYSVNASCSLSHYIRQPSKLLHRCDAYCIHSWWKLKEYLTSGPRTPSHRSCLGLLGCTKL